MDDRRRQWLEAIAGAADEQALAQVESRLFGKKGEVQELVRSVSQLPRDERPAAGKAANRLKQELEQVPEYAIESRARTY